MKIQADLKIGMVAKCSEIMSMLVESIGLTDKWKKN
jgi:hypothetical protein